MIILLYVEPGFFIHTNDDEFINLKRNSNHLSSFLSSFEELKKIKFYF